MSEIALRNVCKPVSYTHLDVYKRQVEFHTCELGYETAKGLFARRVMTAGTLVNAKTIRFEPTAVISEQDIKDVISRMDEALDVYKRQNLRISAVPESESKM